MGLIHIVRDKPEYPNGACSMDIQEQDLPKLQARGWREETKKPVKDFVKEPAKEPVKEDAKNSSEDVKPFSGFQKGK